MQRQVLAFKVLGKCQTAVAHYLKAACKCIEKDDLGSLMRLVTQKNHGKKGESGHRRENNIIPSANTSGLSPQTVEDEILENSIFIKRKV